jgi:hypothetical protein
MYVELDLRFSPKVKIEGWFIAFIYFYIFGKAKENLIE